MFVDAGGGATQERCIPIPQWARAKPVAVRTRQTNFLMAVEMQQTRDRLMATGTQYLGDDLDTKAIHPSQQKMTKRQWTGIRLMAAGTRHEDSSLKAETNPFLKRE